MGKGYFPLPQTHVAFAEHVVRSGILWRELDYQRKGFGCFRISLSAMISISEVELKVGVLGFQVRCFLILDQGIGMTFELVKFGAQVIECVRILRHQLNRIYEGSTGLLVTLEIDEDISEVIVRFAIIRPKGNDYAIGFDGIVIAV